MSSLGVNAWYILHLTGGSNCPGGYTRVGAKGLKYFDTLMRQTDANDTCVSEGATLIEVQTEEEYNYSWAQGKQFPNRQNLYYTIT